MRGEKIIEALRLLAEAVSLVTVNTYVEQGAPAADKVFAILAKVEEIVKEDEVKTCDTCLYEDSYVNMPPCSLCTRTHDTPPTQWEPKEGEG